MEQTAAVIPTFVVGFYFDGRDRSTVLLLRKQRPEWQKGCLNGVGGKVREGELPVDAMVREFREEAGVETKPEQWELFVDLYEPATYRVLFYWTAAPEGHSVDYVLPDTDPTDEELEVVDVFRLSEEPKMIGNLLWMIPLSQDPGLQFPITIRDSAVDQLVDGLRPVAGSS